MPGPGVPGQLIPGQLIPGPVMPEPAPDAELESEANRLEGAAEGAEPPDQPLVCALADKLRSSASKPENFLNTIEP